jgi:hypothetical protein
MFFLTHCNAIYVFPEMKLRGFGPIHIRVSVSDLYIPRIPQAAQFHFWEFVFEFSVSVFAMPRKL